MAMRAAPQTVTKSTDRLTKRQQHDKIRAEYAERLSVGLLTIIRAVPVRTVNKVKHILANVREMEDGELLKLHFDEVDGPGCLIIIKVKSRKDAFKIAATVDTVNYIKRLEPTHPDASHRTVEQHKFSRRIAAAQNVRRRLAKYVIPGHPTWFATDLATIKAEIAKELHRQNELRGG